MCVRARAHVCVWLCVCAIIMANPCRYNMRLFVCVSMHVRVCVCVRARARVCPRVRVCVCVCVIDVAFIAP